MKENSHGESYKNKKNWLEWTVFGGGLGLTVAIISYLVYKTATYNSGPPELYVKYYPEPGRYEPHRYHVILKNEGNETAESVTVEISLLKGKKVLEKAELSVDYCPKESSREGWVSFNNNPKLADTVVARVMSYEKP
ncbi:hypothetical protein [Persicitalea jodogahamensis]|nr:hypothetical protein [Persicitalea jodogahamensis]